MSKTTTIQLDSLSRSSNSDEQQENLISDKSKSTIFAHRTTSLQVASLNFCKLLIGSGCFTLPIGVLRCNIIPYIVVIVIMGIYNAVTGILVINACEVYNVFEFSELLCKFSKLFEITAAGLTSFVLICALISFGILGSDFLKYIAITYNYDHVLRWQFLLFLCIFIFLPLSLLKKLVTLKFTSFLGMFAIGYIIVYVIVLSITNPQFLDENDDKSFKNIYEWNVSGVFIAASLAGKAFVGQYALPIMYKELRQRSIKRMSIVIIIGYTTATLVFVTFGICGYIAFGKSVKGDISNNFPSDIWSTIARAGMLLSIIGTYPIVFKSQLTQLERFFFSSDTSKICNFKRNKALKIIFTIFLVFICGFIGMITDSIAVVNGVEGAASILGIECLIPVVACWSIVSKNRKASMRFDTSSSTTYGATSNNVNMVKNVNENRNLNICLCFSTNSKLFLITVGISGAVVGIIGLYYFL